MPKEQVPTSQPAQIETDRVPWPAEARPGNHSEKRDHMKELFEELGLDVEKMNPNILRKLTLLNDKTETFKDEERSVHIARALFRHYENRLPHERFTGQEQRTVLIGTMFTDIGKTGPRNATPEQEELILSIFNVESRKHGQADVLSVEEYIKDHFPDAYTDKIEGLRAMGLDTNMTMRQFWNMHSQWTLEIISGDGLPPEAVAAAATHHMLEGVNPQEIVGKDGRFTKYFGDNVYFDRAEKLIIILDKYDAARRRGQMSHDKAVEFVRNKIKTNPNFAEDKEFEGLLINLDAMLSANAQVYEE